MVDDSYFKILLPVGLLCCLFYFLYLVIPFISKSIRAYERKQKIQKKYDACFARRSNCLFHINASESRQKFEEVESLLSELDLIDHEIDAYEQHLGRSIFKFSFDDISALDTSGGKKSDHHLL